jgi:ribonuclease Z
MAARRQRKVKESTKKGFKTYRSAYYPGTEKLASNEMRITALGTGMPIYRPSQMSAGWFVELGNGDKFIFDIGTGCMRNFSALEVPYDEANKLFLTHLHTDHVGDFPYWYVGGWITRQSPVYIWGPSGMTRELGTKYCIEKLVEAYTWDITSRIGELPEPGREYHIEEFDYTQMNKIVYQKNGVTIRSFPQIHAIDGAVAYTLEWKGLKFVYGGLIKQNQDLLLHITFSMMMEQ